jgi:hypothetical protein
VASAPAAATADVASIIPERVSDPGGDFTSTTNPPQEQVQAIIGQLVAEVQALCGLTIDDSLKDFATLVVATGAAAQVELGFTNDLGGDKTSKYEQLDLLFEARLARLHDAQSVLNTGGTLGGVDDTIPENAYYTFPDTSTDTRFGFPITTWDSRF